MNDWLRLDHVARAILSHINGENVTAEEWQVLQDEAPDLVQDIREEARIALKAADQVVGRLQ